MLEAEERLFTRARARTLFAVIKACWQTFLHSPLGLNNNTINILLCLNSCCFFFFFSNFAGCTHTKQLTSQADEAEKWERTKTKRHTAHHTWTIKTGEGEREEQETVWKRVRDVPEILEQWSIEDLNDFKRKVIFFFLIKFEDLKIPKNI